MQFQNMTSQNTIHSFTHIPAVCRKYQTDSCSTYCTRAHVKCIYVCLNYYITGRCIDISEGHENFIHKKYTDFPEDIMKGLDKLIDRKSAPKYRIRRGLSFTYYPPKDLKSFGDSTRSESPNIEGRSWCRQGEISPGNSPVAGSSLSVSGEISPINIPQEFKVDKKFSEILSSLGISEYEEFFAKEEFDLDTIKQMQQKEFAEFEKKYNITLKMGIKLKLIKLSKEL